MCALALDSERDPIVCEAGAHSMCMRAETSESGLCVFFRLIRGSLRLVEQHNDCCLRGVLTQIPL